MKVRNGLAGVLALTMAALASTAMGAEKEKKAAKAGPPDEKAAMEAMMKAGTPGDAHKKLEPMVGTFDVKVKMWMDPSKPPEETTGKAENRWVLGNRYVQQSFEGTAMGQPFSGMGFMGYDNITKEYTGTWVDSMSTATMNSTGKLDATGKVMTLTAMVNDPVTGKACKITEKVTVADNDRYMMEMWGPDPSGKNYKMMEIAYVRTK